ncbi:MAG: helix-turn-helix domain-containing protein [Candidatus Helarchaeota archaeon]
MIETGYEKILGVRSMQGILEFLSIHNTLSIKDLKTFTGYSARTIYDNLKTLLNLGMVVRRKRGVYKLANSRSVQLLAKFYEQIIIEQIGHMLHDITEKIDRGKTKNELESDLKRLETMFFLWEPIFKKFFPSAIPTIFLSLKDR